MNSRMTQKNKRMAKNYKIKNKKAQDLEKYPKHLWKLCYTKVKIIYSKKNSTD